MEILFIMKPKLWLIPIAFFLLGGVLFVSGIGWAIASGVCVPDQDPMPAMQAYAQFHNRIVEILMSAGMFAFVAAVVSALVLLIRRFGFTRQAGS